MANQQTANVQLGPVSTALGDTVKQHTVELDRRRALLRSWSARRREGVSRGEVQRGMARLESEITGLRRAFHIAVDVESWIKVK